MIMVRHEQLLKSQNNPSFILIREQRGSNAYLAKLDQDKLLTPENVFWYIYVDIGSDNGLLPHSTKVSPSYHLSSFTMTETVKLFECRMPWNNVNNKVHFQNKDI